MCARGFLLLLFLFGFVFVLDALYFVVAIWLNVGVSFAISFFNFFLFWRIVILCCAAASSFPFVVYFFRVLCIYIVYRLMYVFVIVAICSQFIASCVYFYLELSHGSYARISVARAHCSLYAHTSTETNSVECVLEPGTFSRVLTAVNVHTIYIYTWWLCVV